MRVQGPVLKLLKKKLDGPEQVHPYKLIPKPYFLLLKDYNLIFENSLHPS